MIFAALYARKSTEQVGVSDDLRSIGRQVDHARAYAKANGWFVDEAHIFIDDGISGAEFATRPGLSRLLLALKPKPPFQVVIVSEESRLGRETIETAYVLKQLITAGVRVFSYLDNRERTLNTPIEKAMLSLQAMADEIEREKSRVRTFDALLSRAQSGKTVGGSCFGYRNDRHADGVRRVIHPEEAAVVRRIFTMAAQHHGLGRIAKILNDEGLPCPRPQQGRPAGWAPSSIHALLRRDVYRGVAVWNKTRKRDQWGVKHQQPRPERDWLRVEVPGLAIVDESLWAAAHAAMTQRRTRFSGERFRSPGRLPGGDGVDTRYLLAGLLQCSHCRGSMEVRTRSHGPHRVPFVGCSSFHRRGRRVCPTNLTVPEAHANAAVLAELESSLLNARVLEAAVERAVGILCQPDDDGQGLRHELVRLEREIRRYTEAVAAGGDVPFLVARLRAADDRRREFAARLQVVEAAAHELDPRQVRADLRTRLADWRSILFGEPVKARGLIRQLIIGRLELVADADRHGFRFTGTGTLVPLLTGVIPGVATVLSRNGASPGGHSILWHPPLAGWMARVA